METENGSGVLRISQQQVAEPALGFVQPSAWAHTLTRHAAASLFQQLPTAAEAGLSRDGWKLPWHILIICSFHCGNVFEILHPGNCQAIFLILVSWHLKYGIYYGCLAWSSLVLKTAWRRIFQSAEAAFAQSFNPFASFFVSWGLHPLPQPPFENGCAFTCKSMLQVTVQEFTDLSPLFCIPGGIPGHQKPYPNSWDVIFSQSLLELSFSSHWSLDLPCSFPPSAPIWSIPGFSPVDFPADYSYKAYWGITDFNKCLG